MMAEDEDETDVLLVASLDEKSDCVLDFRVIVVVAVGGISAKDDNFNRNGGSVSTSVKAVCDGTLYPDSCYSRLNPLVRSSHKDQPEKFFKLSVQVAKDELSRALQFFYKDGPLLSKGITEDTMSIAALKSCCELLGLALDHLESSLLTTGDLSLFEAMEDLKTWLSSAGTCQQTCMNGFDDNASLESLKTSVSKYLQNFTEFTSNSLTIMN
ncbi:hypothetical protein Acr_24g0007260 [Actinidia rufa]|uniref:Pectinesterase inhibitor domain-containing protein n=1 Tax=Actinidia rufa TaxID=165716 RepID=A0A7J0GUS7_9ERIC|nr:hypothetical protein Acr_24g0007260 [Actinidia rufa]